MSKKKRIEKKIDHEIAEDLFQELKAEALDFLEEATPFEISYELTQRGISTAHKEGIFLLLDANLQSQFAKNQTYSASNDKSQEVIAQTWRKEIESKGRKLTFDDLAFLSVAATHFSMDWSLSRLEMSEARIEELEAAQKSVHYSSNNRFQKEAIADIVTDKSNGI
jgi:hypothetical protein